MTTGDRAHRNVHEIFEKCIGCKWTLHVLGQIRSGTHRPGQLERTAAGLTTKVLNERLVKLVRFGILEKTSWPEVPPRVEYHLTPFGCRFVEILDQVGQLQEEYGGGPDEQPAQSAGG
ncbi:MAG: winged helix-turn-helix transcriptional regulator [Maioricimonas sp. JB049]